MSHLIPRWGPVGRFLNPGPFQHERTCRNCYYGLICFSFSATSTLVIAAQKLYYGGYPNQGGAIFITMATQRMCLTLSAGISSLSFCRNYVDTDRPAVIGYGLAGMMRRVLLWPTKMLYPENLPITTVLETLHRDKAGNKKRMKVFWMIFATLLVWEIVPEVGILMCTTTTKSLTSYSI